jgi:hypothetical protein
LPLKSGTINIKNE